MGQCVCRNGGVEDLQSLLRFVKETIESSEKYRYVKTFIKEGRAYYYGSQRMHHSQNTSNTTPKGQKRLKCTMRSKNCGGSLSVNIDPGNAFMLRV